MMMQQPVVVRRGGFFSAIVHGVFGLLVVGVICGTAVGLYGMNIVDRHSGQISGMAFQALADWRKIAPPAVVEALNDRRMPQYLDNLTISTEMIDGSLGSDLRRVLLTIRNGGDETVSMLALRVMLEDDDSVPRAERSLYAATPIMLDEDNWRGPLLPGATRRIVVMHCRGDGASKASVEVAELRVSTPPAGEPAPAPRDASGENTALRG